MPRQPNQLNGVSIATPLVDSRNGADLFARALGLAVELHEHGMALPLKGSLQIIDSMLASMNARCTLSAPPVDIEMVTDASGDLVYRCKHKNPHQWPV